MRTLALAFLVALVACSPRPGPSRAPAGASAERPSAAGVVPAAIEPGRLRETVAFLADDAQEGRAPGTEADARVRAYVAEQMAAVGLAPGASAGFVQTFEVTDGVRLVEGARSKLQVGKVEVEHAIVPFSTSTAEPARGRLVYVGTGVAPRGVGSGDYEGIEGAVRGKIAVALDADPANPHIPPHALRPQARALAAKDQGAVGFILWEPKGPTEFPNGGRAEDLGIPAVHVGALGGEVLARALKAREGTPEVGQVSRRVASLHTPIERVRRQTANVVGVLPGAEDGGPIVVLGAHMDHLGWGRAGSLAPGKRAIHNGADDNASGVALMLEVARALAAVPPERRGAEVRFVAFGAEEMGLLGSRHYVQSLDAATLARVVAMINFDMVGRLRDEGVIVAGAGTAEEWEGILRDAAGDLPLRPTPDGHGPSDHSSFYEAKIPVLHFFTGPHPDYHKPSDDADKVNLEGAARIGEVAVRVVRALWARGAPLTYVKVDRPRAAVRGFRVSLGTVPDYGASVDGVRLSDVRGGGAADRAGLRGGDVIVHLGGRDVHNLEDYMAALGELEPGAKTTVVIQRGERRLELELTPDAPRRH